MMAVVVVASAEMQHRHHIVAYGNSCHQQVNPFCYDWYNLSLNITMLTMKLDVDQAYDVGGRGYEVVGDNC